MKKCPVCGDEFPEAAMICKRDQKALVKVPGLPAQQPGSGSSGFSDPEYDQGTHSQGNRDMLFGGLWFAGGVLVTLVTYSSASSGGGHYVVAWGAIIFGAIQFLRGLGSN